MRHPHILERDDALLLIVDIQERLAATMEYRDKIVQNVGKLIFAMKRLDLPILLTEQYPRGLGRTAPEIMEQLDELYQPIEKLTFSCCGAEELGEVLRKTERKTGVLVGMETHVCVIQTALDMIAMGYQVHVPSDAVCSRRKNDWQTALERMRGDGAVITTTESVIFELLVRAGTPEFKDILPILR